MKTPSPEFAFDCPADEISAYIDGELPPDAELALERHLTTCITCRSELNDQKGFLLALSGTLESEIDVELPENFTRAIVANAESNVSGLRNRRERSSALIIGGVLFGLAILALGGVTGVFSPIRTGFDKLATLLGTLFQVAADLLYAISAMARSILQTQTFSNGGAYIALTLILMLVLYFGTRSLRRYFRS